MRFKYCGDLDTPDWVLSKILLISKLSINDLKSLADHVIAVILKQQINELDKFSEQVREYKLKEVDCKGMIAALTFIFKSSAKYTCDHNILSRELQQLGLHKHGAQTLSEIYKLKFKDLRQMLGHNSLRINKLLDVSWITKRTSKTDKMGCDIPLIMLNFSLVENDKNKNMSVIFTLNKFLVLSEELKRIKKTMQKINTQL